MDENVGEEMLELNEKWKSEGGLWDKFSVQ